MAFLMKLQEEYFPELLDLKHVVPSADILLWVFAIIVELRRKNVDR